VDAHRLGEAAPEVVPARHDLDVDAWRLATTASPSRASPELPAGTATGKPSSASNGTTTSPPAPDWKIPSRVSRATLSPRGSRGTLRGRAFRVVRITAPDFLTSRASGC
jgi:hypothetical protein